MTARFEWSSTDPTAEELEIEAYVFDDNRPWYEQPAASGPSPLQIAVNFTGPKLDVQPHFEFGPARNGALPVYAAKTVVDQKVSITIYETYHCSASVHPDGIKPSA